MEKIDFWLFTATSNQLLQAGGVFFISVFGFFVWAYILAHYGVFFTFVKSGEIVLVEMGKSFYKLIPNIPGYGVKDNKITRNKDENGVANKGVKISKSFFGVFWVGFYPIQKIHGYPFGWTKLISENEKEEEKKKGAVIEETPFGMISHRSEMVSSMRHKNIYPVILTKLEMQGQISIDISFEVIFESVDPVYSVFILNGRWFEAAVSSFNGIVSDTLREMKLRRTTEIKTEEKKEGEFLEETDKESWFNESLLKKNNVIADASGVRIAKVIYKDYAISGSKEAKEATEGLKLAELNAQTKKVEGEGEGAKLLAIKKAEADGIKVLKEAEAAGIRMVKKAEVDMFLETLKSAKEHSQGGDVVIAKEYAEAIKNYAGSTIIFGASNVSPMIPIDNDKKKKGDKK